MLVAIPSDLELYQKEAGGTIISSLNSKVNSIDSFTNNMDSAVRSYIDRLRKLTYSLSYIWDQIEATENLEIKITRREDERSLGGPNWMVGILERGRPSRS